MHELRDEEPGPEYFPAGQRKSFGENPYTGWTSLKVTTIYKFEPIGHVYPLGHIPQDRIDDVFHVPVKMSDSHFIDEITTEPKGQQKPG